MSEAVILYKIMVYPIKSLPPVELVEAKVTKYGTLEWDRVYAIVDEKGRIVNGKRERRLHLIRARYDLNRGLVALEACCSGEEVFKLAGEEGEIARWLSRFLGYRVELVYRERGWPDDERFNGPTVISTGTLAEVARWFGWDLMQARLRFRSNLEVLALEPFWEDRLYKSGGRVVFRVGSVTLAGMNISSRCVVPSRDPFTAAPARGFQRRFVEMRRPTLRVPLDHSYRLAINTVVLEGHGGKVKVGDPVEVVG